MLLLPRPLLYIIEIDGQHGWWEAMDPACAFSLLSSSAALPKGWTCISVPMEVPRDTHAMPMFRVDTGHGFQSLPVILQRRAPDGCWTFVTHVPADTVAISLSPMTRLGPFRLGPLQARPISRAALAARLALLLAARWFRDPPSLLRAGRMMATAWQVGGRASLRNTVGSILVGKTVSTEATSSADRYARWIVEHEAGSPTAMPHVPGRFSVLIPFAAGQTRRLAVTLRSLKAQSSATWNCQVGLAPNASIPRRSRDRRISYIRLMTAEHGAMLAALAVTTESDMLLVLEPGDRLAPDALAALSQNPQIGIVYGDEDRIGRDGRRCMPFLKPQWSPELLHAFNYFGRPVALRRTWVERVGGFRSGTGAAAEWDLHLRMCQADAPVMRVPRVLCHCRHDNHQDRPVPHWSTVVQDETRQDPASQYRAVITDYWTRMDVAAAVTTQLDGTQRSVWTLIDPPLVSIIIVNSAQTAALSTCLHSIAKVTDYPHVQVIVVDSGATQPTTLALYKRLISENHGELVSCPDHISVAAARNAGARAARGDLLLFLDPTIEVTVPDWLKELVQFAIRPGVGVVGPLVVDARGVLQHAGITIGMQLCGPLFRGASESDWGPIGSPMIPRTVSAIAGGCQMVQRKVFDQIGGFDESYITANSDVALCLSARAAGWRIVYTPFSRLVQRPDTGINRRAATEDMMRIGIALRRFGYEHDPFFHPALDAGSAVPRLRVGAEPENAASLHASFNQFRQAWTGSGLLDLGNDADVAAATDMPVTAVIWPPQSASAIEDQWSAARWCIDLLRRRQDLRQRFPDALSAGGNGAFSHWVRTDGITQFGLTTQASEHIRTALAGGIAAPARQAVLIEATLSGPMAVAFLPIGRAALLRFLLQRERNYPRLEEIWWLALTCAEDPARELVFSYRFNPDWQALFPDGLTIFGQDRFSAWFRAAYQCDAAWTHPGNWPATLSPADQIRIGWNANQSWQQRYPDPFANPDNARALIDWLISPAAGAPNTHCPANARAWLATMPPAAIAELLPGPGLNVIAHFCYPSGLRTSALSVVQGLHASGYDVTLRDVPVDVRHDVSNHATYDGLELHDITLLHIQPEPFFLRAFEHAGLNPRERRSHRIGYWYWELEAVPKSWAAAVAAVDEVWVATRFVGDALRSRFDVPVFDLMPGVQLPGFTKRSPVAFGIPPGRFTFLFVFHMMSIMERKNPLGLIRAFGTAFSAADPVTLVLKTSFGDKHPVLIRQLHEAASQSGGKVIIIDEVFSNDETISLMDACNAYISLHRSEGLGLTMAEAMLLGKPVIATGYSGNLAFMGAQNSLLVEHRLINIDHDIPLYERGSVWADPSEAHAARLMRQVWENPDAAASLGAHARIDIQNNLSIAAAGERMVGRLAAIRARSRTGQPKMDADANLAVQLR